MVEMFKLLTCYSRLRPMILTHACLPSHAYQLTRLYHSSPSSDFRHISRSVSETVQHLPLSSHGPRPPSLIFAGVGTNLTMERHDHSQNIVVIGSGVLGLSAALLLQDSFPAITIVASEFPTTSPITLGSSSVPASADYASMWAGAHYRPIPYLPESEFGKFGLSHQQQEFHIQLAREKNLAVATAKTMKEIASCHPESGVQIVRGEEYLESPPAEILHLSTGDVYAFEGDGFRVLDQSDLAVLNGHASAVQKGDVKWGCAYDTYVVNVHVYCGWLLHRFLSKGGKTVQKKLQNTSDAFELVETNQKDLPLVVNCSGRSFDTDPAVKHIRGQTVLVRNQYDRTITRQCEDGSWSFLIPRPLNGGTIVGGTKEIGDTETKPRPATRQKLLENAAKYFPNFVANVNDFDVVADNVGRRPWRAGGMRIEVEHSAAGRTIVHGYGAGGRGYELSWGIAQEILAHVEQNIRDNSNTLAKL